MKTFLITLLLLPTLCEASWVCEARNLVGRRYSATGDSRALVQEAALKACENQSLRCYATGCDEATEAVHLGCRIEIVGIHPVPARQCPRDEVVVGYDMGREVLFCGFIRCG